jgi:ArsR family transcriptional regulator
MWNNRNATDRRATLSGMEDSDGGWVAPSTANGNVRADPVYVVKARMFRTLGHPVRIRILELLRDGERSVGDVQLELNLDSSGTSQHLSALRQLGLLDSHRVGTSVFYSIADPRVTELLAAAKQILTSALTVSHSLLGGLADEPREDATQT